MKLTFRDLKQQKFFIDAEPSDTIAQVKEKIANEKGWEIPQQKLIYSGKILQDANTIESYKIEEKGFIVCMVSKPKPAPSAASSSKAPSTPATAPIPAPSAPAAAPSNPPSTGGAQASAPSAGAAPAEPQTAAPTFNDPSTLLIGNQSEAAISHMESMGFPRSEVERAMRAAFMNPDRAVEYLLSGIPEEAQQAAEPAPATTGTPAAAPQATGATSAPNPEGEVNLFEAAAQAGNAGARGPAVGAQPEAGAAEGAGAPGGLGGLEFLRNNAHFQQLRQLVQQQPQMLEPILQQVMQGNPQFADLIRQNQGEFLELLSQDLRGEDGQQAPPGAHTISVTEEERDAIERLCRLGFPRDSVIQAYFACDKNEELAANFLFDQPDDDN